MAVLSETERQEAEALFAELESDEIQSRLRPGFERDFSNSLLEQWDRSEWLSPKQLYWLGEIVKRHRSRSAPSPSRRYEGWQPTR